MTHPPDQVSGPEVDRAQLLAWETFDIEAAAVLGLKQRVGKSFSDAVATMLAAQGRVVVMALKESQAMTIRAASGISHPISPSG